ncbi:hypothetical protein [Sphingomonas sp.]|uniref:hypothetical protein n=1 Tax=Sphingomonas sp. TaxID=28214 RepID=UPI0025DD5E36|nr:hypothetical protein [Sphingomonas sp.]
MPRGRKKGEIRLVPEPVWIAPFLSALAVTGNVGASAEIAGIDVTGVYRRKTRDAGFREQWAAVLSAREARASGVVAPAVSVVVTPVLAAPEAIGAKDDGSAGAISAAAAAAAMGLRPRMTASGVKLARVGTRRWSAKAEGQFLVAMANCANMAVAASVAGFSKAAVSKRRLKDARFAAAWDLAMEVGQVRIQAGLIAQAARAYDVDELLAEGEVALPPMSNAERMAVAKMPLGRAKVGAKGAAVDVFAERAAAMSDGEKEDLPDRLLEKLWRTRKLIMQERRRLGGIEVGKLVLEPGWVWQGEGPMPQLPGQDDDQGWDAMPERLARGEARRRAAGRSDC